MTQVEKYSWVLMGDETLLVQCGSLLLERGHTLGCVVTGNEAICAWAREQGVSVVAPGRELARALSDVSYDWFLSVANLRIVPEPVWRGAKIGTANFHDGLLPESAGLNTPAWAILEGKSSHGVTWHALSSGIDEGDIYASARFDVSENDTSLTLNTKCFEAGIDTFVTFLDTVENKTVTGEPQDLESRTYYSKSARPAMAATIDFTTTSGDIDRLSRGLSFGEGYANPLCLPKVWVSGRAYNVGSVVVEPGDSSGRPGLVIAVDSDGAVVATADGAVRLSGLSDEAGMGVPVEVIFKQGETVAPVPSDVVERLSEFIKDTVSHEGYFQEKLEQFTDLDLYGVAPVSAGDAPRFEALAFSLPGDLRGHRAVASICAYLARVTSQEKFDTAFVDDALSELVGGLRGYVGTSVPLSVRLGDDANFEDLAGQIDDELNELARRKAYFGDLVSRTPKLSSNGANVAIRLTGNNDLDDGVVGSALTFVIPTDGNDGKIIFDTRRLSSKEAEATLKRLCVVLEACARDAKQTVFSLPLMSADAQTSVVYDYNDTKLDFEREELVHGLIEAQARKTPQATALVCDGESLTYEELDKRSTDVAKKLSSMGVVADTLVGLYLNRSCDLVVGALAIMKSGGAYVPLDPTYPSDRIEMMIADGGLDVVLTEQSIFDDVALSGVRKLTIEAALAESGLGDHKLQGVSAENLAYVIFTSGSTGRPKGVMVEHRNVVNFFAGMSSRISTPKDEQPVWLAVTSLSFDISVLELFWTLANGFKVVIHADDKRALAQEGMRARAARVAGGMDYSLFHWGNDDGPGPRKYKLLLDSARFADQHGFRAVWTPERHFHAFGGPYPNPAVTGAAVAAVTENLDIRAGSCVLPLHHPARVAEEWAVIDNISNGRVGLAVASGWMPEDFLLRPENAPPNNKASMLRDMEVLRKLWRGDKVQFEAPDGKLVDVTTLPRPVSRDIPLWVTTAGNPDTYREAARHGANVLTHLLGQSIDEVGEKIKIYREELVKCGRDPDQYTVTLMLHTLLGEDREEVRRVAREPMINYLRSAAGLIKQYAWAFPAFKKPEGVKQPFELDLGGLEDEELDAILDFAFLRYFDDSGLFGTVEDAIARTEQIAKIGVNEIACLIDFGVETDEVLRSLEPLAEVVAAINPPQEPVVLNETYSIADVILRHGVTHIQCTPSMANMMLMDDENRKALRRVSHLFVGGEAFQGTLLNDLESATDASIENMYGPTETTIWSSTGVAAKTDGTVAIGSPIANTQLYVLDKRLNPVPPGLPGELYIGGEGVARGYFNQVELTAERFLANPFVEGERMYRTGDVLRRFEDGSLDFIGRLDHQVKLRGYRIELGEIEACIGKHPAVGEAVVVVRADKPNDERIVAYVRYEGKTVSDEEMRTHIGKTLPEFMVPARFVKLDRFPLTPNAKVDRKALPKPEDVVSQAPAIAFVAPDSDVEKLIAESYKKVLGVERVGMNDNFFTLGGHSLLAVQMHRDLKASLGSGLTITDIYQFPTIAGLSNHIRDRDQVGKKLDQVADRAAARRKALSGRRAGVSRMRERS